MGPTFKGFTICDQFYRNYNVGQPFSDCERRIFLYKSQPGTHLYKLEHGSHIYMIYNVSLYSLNLQCVTTFCNCDHVTYF